MILTPVSVDCQVPPNSRYSSRIFNIIRCELRKDSDEYTDILTRSEHLAHLVSAGAANNSQYARTLQRRRVDSFGGLCAESGWEQYINSCFNNIASPTPFTAASVQIDIALSQGQKIEVRSSFPRNGVKFAVCNSGANFKNIGPYSNSIKPGEIQKNMYLAVLFDTPKVELLTSDTVTLSLVGGSTWNMMVNQGVNVTLTPWDDDSFAVRSSYRVVYLNSALDSSQVIAAIEQMGYQRQ
ncbi:MAG: hypothetical protein HQ510_04255 [Candidatus Marinimicrobia bacterium]|nr:hypothetical protein [Candidatus Neomarinimicrobiota bacterium]